MADRDNQSDIEKYTSKTIIIDANSSEEKWNRTMIGIWPMFNFGNLYEYMLLYLEKNPNLTWDVISTLNHKSFEHYMRLCYRADEVLINLCYIRGNNIAVSHFEAINPYDNIDKYSTSLVYLSIAMNNQMRDMVSKLDKLLKYKGVFDDKCKCKTINSHLNKDKLNVKLQLSPLFKTIHDECEVYENNTKMTNILFDKNTFFNPGHRYELAVRVLIRPNKNINEIVLLVVRLKIDTSA